MIRVSVLYPNNPSATFNMDYYLNTHVPMVGQLLGDSLKGAIVDSGIAGGAPGESAAFIAMVHLTFDTVESFQESFGPNADQIMGDIPNFTNTQPQIQISDIKL